MPSTSKLASRIVGGEYTAITYNAGTNIIQIVGYTEGTPCNFTDIYNADVAGAWGVVFKQGAAQFLFDACLKIGDGSTATWLGATDVMVSFKDSISATWTRFLISGEINSHIIFGNLINDSKKITDSGVTLYLGNAVASIGRNGSLSNIAPDIRFYSCKIYSTAAQHIFRVTGKMYNTDMEACDLYQCSIDYYNVYFVSGLTIFGYPGGTFDIINIKNSSYPIYIGSAVSATCTFYNIVLKGNTYAVRIESSSSTVNIVNADVDSWVFLWQGGSGTARIYRQYEFDLKVIDKDNVAINAATVKIWDKDSNLIVDTTTNASGVIATQTITRGYYNQANGNTLQEASPHLIKIEKAGYTTYEADFTLEDKTDWTIALQTSILRNPSMSGGMV